MKQIKFAIKDLKNNWGKYLVLFVQICSSLILIASLLLMYSNTFDYESKLAKLNSYGKGNYLYDRTESNYIMEKIAEKESLPKLEELYDYIFDNKNIKALSFNNNYSTQINEEDIDLIEVTPNFSDYFNLTLSEGKLFEESDFTNKTNEIPIIMGSDFKNKYTLNQVIKNDEYSYKIIGFLLKNEYYLDLKADLGSEENLNHSILKPIQKENLDSDLYDTVINKAYIFTNNYKNLTQLKEVSTKLGLYDFEIISFDDRMQSYKQEMNLVIQYLLFILSSILIFSLISIISNLLINIRKNQKEFVIHLLCGATIKDIALRLILQVFIVILIAGLINFCVFGIVQETLIAFLIGILLGILILILPLMQLRKQNINQMLRRYD